MDKEQVYNSEQNTTMVEVVMREIVTTVKAGSVLNMLTGHRNLEQDKLNEFTFELHGCKFKVTVTEIESAE